MEKRHLKYHRIPPLEELSEHQQRCVAIFRSLVIGCAINGRLLQENEKLRELVLPVNHAVSQLLPGKKDKNFATDAPTILWQTGMEPYEIASLSKFFVAKHASTERPQEPSGRFKNAG